MRVQVEERPRIESINTSSTASNAAIEACFDFQRSSPASAASLSGELATTMSGILLRDADVAREGATRGPSPSILRKCGGHGASPSPADSSAAANSNNLSSDPGSSFMPACGSPSLANRAGTVRTVKSAGSQPGTSSQWSGVETRASGTGRTEYAEQVVRSF